MKIFVDIDKTLAQDPEGRNTASYLARRIGIPSSQSLTLKDYMSRAEVKAWAEASPLDFKKIWEARQDDADIHWAAVPAPGSRLLLRLLALGGSLSYFTCRLPQAREVTQTWLEKHGYPHPDRVYYCDHFLHKIEKVTELTANSTHPIIIIDDHAIDLLKSIAYVGRTKQGVADRIRQHFLLIQFGTEQVEIEPRYRRLVRVAGLPGWRAGSLLRAIGRLRTAV